MSTERSMTEEKKEEKEELSYQGATTKHRITFGKSARLSYRAIADWMVLRKEEKPVARMFHVAYLAERQTAKNRPITFVFNGGPGAASAYLHMGALGPRRAIFKKDGSLPAPPAKLADNKESWLQFTDLVFIDPIGTGFSRTIEAKEKRAPDAKDAQKKGSQPRENKEFWELERDLESLGEFIQKFLSTHCRWTSPIFIAGESYGGFRVAKLARKLQETYGVGLNGAVLISPAIEFNSLFGSDYNMSHWIELFPSLAAAAWIHGKAVAKKGTTLEKYLIEAETFAQTELAALLGQGEAMAPVKRTQIHRKMAKFLGIEVELIARAEGRIDHFVFARELLRDQRKFCGMYDASLTAVDPFPNRNHYEGPDPTLMSIDRVFRAAINSHLRETLSLETEMDYELLSFKVNQSWKWSKDEKFVLFTLGAMDDLRYGMTLNPYMKVHIAHGYFDLVTPYFSTNRLVEHMKLDASLRPNLTTQHYRGGHMFYTWESSRKAFTKQMKGFYQQAIRRQE